MNAVAARDVWTSCLGSLQLEVTRHNFDTWLKGTVGLDTAQDLFVVGVPNAFVGECLEKRMAPLVGRTLQGLLQRPMRVEYRVFPSPSPNGDQAGTTLTLVPSLAEPAASERSRPGPGLGSLNPRYSFDTFVVGKSNRFAHAVATAVSDAPGRPEHNPLFIHAGVGLGKTHLLHAIGHAVRAKGLPFLYVSAEQYTNTFIRALRDGQMEDFRHKYRDLEVLLIDDIQFIAGKEHSRESFFHTFNDLHLASKQIVITSDSRPKSIPLLEERLRSRFEGGVMADIQPPDLETRIAILSKKADHAPVHISPGAIDLLARKIALNVRELEGALNGVVAMATAAGQPVDVDMVLRALADANAAPRARRAAAGDVVPAVARHYELEAKEITGTSRRATVALARQVAAYLLREQTSLTLAEIGHILGGRGHTTALRSHQKIAYEVNSNAALAREIAEIREALDRLPT